jgi:endogenous inhibitor of DNA gyrase (YacG/DUF329 family)
MPQAQCPTCREPVEPRKTNPFFPFCSERCRTLDLGRWLGEAYRIAPQSADEDEDGDALPGRPHVDA